MARGVSHQRCDQESRGALGILMINRYEGNPILTHADVPYSPALAYNGSVIRWEGK